MPIRWICEQMENPCNLLAGCRVSQGDVPSRRLPIPDARSETIVGCRRQTTGNTTPRNSSLRQ